MNNNDVIKCPSDYLKTFFKEFKYEVDDLFDQKYEYERNSDRKDEIRLIWTDINKRTELFKAKCEQQLLNQLITNNNNDQIQQIEETLLFEKKTILFLDTLNCSLSLLSGMDSKFILINDEYFNKDLLKEFKKQYYIFKIYLFLRVFKNSL
jgi:hypothetical protein